MEEVRSAFKIVTGTSAEKKPLEKPRRSCEWIKMDLKAIVINTRNWADSAKGSDYWRAFVNAALDLRVL